MRPTAGHSVPAGPQRRPAGFTLVELMLALMIVSLLLAAVGVAMKGSLTSYVENGKIAEVTQTARVVLERLMMEARTATRVDIGEGQVTITPGPNLPGVSQIHYQLINGELYYTQTVGGFPNTVTLISASETVRVQGFTVSREWIDDGQGGSKTILFNARLSLLAGSNPYVVSASSCPRRNMTY